MKKIIIWLLIFSGFNFCYSKADIKFQISQIVNGTPRKISLSNLNSNKDENATIPFIGDKFDLMFGGAVMFKEFILPQEKNGHLTIHNGVWSFDVFKINSSSIRVKLEKMIDSKGNYVTSTSDFNFIDTTKQVYLVLEVNKDNLTVYETESLVLGGSEDLSKALRKKEKGQSFKCYFPSLVHKE